MPNGRPAWWLSNNVAIFPTDESPLALDLETLLLSPLDESPPFKAAEASTKTESKDAATAQTPKPDGWQMKTSNQTPPKKNTAEPARLEFPKRELWQLALDVAVQSIQPPPRKEQSQPWNIGGYATLAFKDIGRRTLQWMPQIVIQPGQLVIPAPDASKMVHHTGSQTEVIYFGTRENVPSVVSIKMPLAQEKKKNDSDLAALLKQHDLCAFAYAPMTNPLNGKTIGPDRAHVRAILRIIKWDADTADFWAAEQFSDMRAGDVVADLHTWEGGKLSPATGIADAKWWVSLAEPPRVDRDSIPTNGAAEDLDKGMALDVSRLTYAFQFQKADHNTHYARPRARVESPPPVEKIPTLETLKINPEPPKSDIPQAEIEKFVFDHHKAASEARVFALMADYADLVEFLGKYRTRAEIQHDEFDYHQKWNHVTETPERPITITKGTLYFVARYSIKFRTECTSENRWVSGGNDIVLSLKPTAKGFEIVSQSAQVHDKQEGALRASEPAPASAATAKKTGLQSVAVTVQKPCWMGAFRAADNQNVIMSDALNLNNGVSIWHRTYQFFGNDGKLLKQCRAEFTGTYAGLGGNAIEVYPNRLAWGNGGDADFIAGLRAFAESFIGQTYLFNVSGENLMMPMNGGINEVLRPVR